MMTTGERRRTAEFFPMAHQTKVGLLNTTVPFSACPTIPVKPVYLSTIPYNTRKGCTKGLLPKVGIVCCLIKVTPKASPTSGCLTFQGMGGKMDCLR